MPGLVYNLMPAQPEIFNAWIPSGQCKTTYLTCPDLNIGRLIFMHTQNNDSFTSLFEQDLAYKQIEESNACDRYFEAFIQRIDPERPNALIRNFGEYVTSLTDEDGDIIVGLKIVHNEFVTPN